MTDGTDDDGRRTILHPRTAAARRHGRTESRGRYVRGHRADAARVEDLVATQRRLALRTAAVVVLVLAGLPLVFALTPQIIGWEPPIGPSLGWLLLSPGIYPLLVVIGRLHERAASRAERRWLDPP